MKSQNYGVTRRPVKTGAPDLFGDKVNELAVEVVNHLHHVDGLLGVHEVVVVVPVCVVFAVFLHLVLT